MSMIQKKLCFRSVPFGAFNLIIMNNFLFCNTNAMHPAWLDPEDINFEEIYLNNFFRFKLEEKLYKPRCLLGFFSLGKNENWPVKIISFSFDQKSTGENWKLRTKQKLGRKNCCKLAKCLRIMCGKAKITGWFVRNSLS